MTAAARAVDGLMLAFDAATYTPSGVEALDGGVSFRRASDGDWLVCVARDRGTVALGRDKDPFVALELAAERIQEINDAARAAREAAEAAQGEAA